jgi:hypothetical protein
MRSAQVWNRATAVAALAYGYNETHVRIVPTAREIEQAETVAEWLALLGHHYGGVPRLVAWAHDDPVWRMAERERYSERTIHNRIDRSVALILGPFRRRRARATRDRRKATGGPSAELRG